MTKRYHVIACDVISQELRHFAAAEQHDHLTFDFLEQGLHNTPDVLRQRLQEAIDQTDGDGYSAILLGYGLCGNGLAGVQARSTLLVVARAHDCITYLLGSKEEYREYFDANPGTYWYSPGWIATDGQPGRDRYERVHQSYVDKYGEKKAEYLMEMEQSWMTRYNNAAYVDMGVGDTEDHKRYTVESADYLNWRCDLLTGSPQLIRQFLQGEWNSGAFLIVEPGLRLARNLATP